MTSWGGGYEHLDSETGHTLAVLTFLCELQVIHLEYPLPTNFGIESFGFAFLLALNFKMLKCQRAR